MKTVKSEQYKRLRNIILPLYEGKVLHAKCLECALTNRNTDKCVKCQADQETEYLLARGVFVKPCEIGAAVWCIVNTKCNAQILSGEIFGISIAKNDAITLFARYKNGKRYAHSIKDYGISLFFTETDALTALDYIKHKNI